MKLKKIFVTLGLSLAVGMGVSAGLCAVGSEAKETNAATSTTVYCALDVNSIVTDLSISNLVVKCNVNYKGDGDDWYAHPMSDIGDGTSYPGKRVYTVTFDDKYNGLGCIQFQVLDGDTWKTQYQVFGTKQWTNPSTYNGKLVELYWSNSSLTGGSWVDYTPTVSKWTVTKMAVEFINGVALEPADWNLGNDEVYDGVSHSIPGATYKNLEHFVGWYTDAACSTIYSGTASVSSDFTIYAKYERLTLDSYFYWIDKESGDLANGYVYFWGEYQTGMGTDGVSIASCKVSDVLSLQGEGHLYKIPVPSSGNISCLLHTSDDNVKTFDITNIVRGAVYYTSYHDQGGDGKYYYEPSPSADEGLAADFLIEFETYRNAVAASSSIKQYSICGISPSDAAKLYVKYENLDENVKAHVDASYTYTYAGKDTTDEDNILFSRIMPEIYNIALKDATFAQTHHAINISPIFINADNSSLIISIAALTAILATGGFFFLRRRKEN